MAFPILPQLVLLSQELPWDTFIFFSFPLWALTAQTDRRLNNLQIILITVPAELGMPISFLQPIAQGKRPTKWLPGSLWFSETAAVTLPLREIQPPSPSNPI